MIQEKRKHKKSKKKPSAMAQVHNRVNAGVMDGVVYGGMMEAAEPEDEEYEIGMEEDGLEPYGHVVAESTDSVTFGGGRLTCYDSNAVPFISFIKKDGTKTKMFVGVNGELHSTMPAVLLSNHDIRKEDFGSLWDIKRDEERSGRVWVNEDCTVISFYSYPNSPKKIYDFCLEALMAVQEKTGAEFNIGQTMVDLWTKNVRNPIIMPVRWFNNGTAEIFLPIVERCEPYEDFTGEYRYRLFTSKGNFTSDWRGDDIEEEESYGALRESKENNMKVDYKKYIKSLIDFMREQHLKIDPLPKIELNPEEQDGIFVKTGYYSPDEKKVVVFTDGRHPKDVLRTVAHEFIHHMQNLQNPDKDWGGGGDLEEDSKLRSIEGEAFLLGNIIFREWTEKMKRTKELNESVIKESPDRLYSLGVNWLAGDAIPFMFYKVDNKFHVGEEGQAHIDMMSELGLDDDSLNDICDDEGFGMYVDLKRTGRYWPSVNAISFWDTPLFQKEILIDTVNRLSSYIDIDFRNLLVDWWEGPADSLIPYRWFVNGTFEMLSEYGVVKVIRGKNNVFDVFTRSGKRFRVDANGDFVENEYAYSYFNESINIKKALVDQKKRRDPDDIERLDEIEAEIVEPDDVDLSSFNIKKHLNPKFWDNGHLDTRIRIKLLDIADDFFDSLEVDWVEPEDVIITGSLANYNWNKKYSDIDLHVLVDYEDVDERVDFVRDFFTLKKNEWNQKHKNLRIFGFPVEVYVQDSNEPHASSGVYSVDKDEWLTEPDIDKLRSGKVNKRHIREMVSTYMNKIDCLIDIYKKHKDDEYEMKKVAKDAAEMFDEIKKLRKDDLGKYGREMCDGNIIFKALRRSDYIGKLIKLKDLTYDKINSL